MGAFPGVGINGARRRVKAAKAEEPAPDTSTFDEMMAEMKASALAFGEARKLAVRTKIFRTLKL